MAVARTDYTSDSTGSAGVTRSVTLNLGTEANRFAVVFIAGENACGSWVRENSTTANDFTKVLLSTCQGYFYREVTGTGSTTIYWRSSSTYEQAHFACYEGVDIANIVTSSHGFSATDRTWSDAHAKGGIFWLAHGHERGGTYTAAETSGETRLSLRTIGSSSAGSRGVASEYQATGSGAPTLGWTTNTVSYGIGPVVFLPDTGGGSGSKIFGGCFIEKAKDILKRPILEQFPLETPDGWRRKDKGLLVPQGI